MQVAGQGGVMVRRELSPRDEAMDCSVDAPHDDAIPSGVVFGSVGEGTGESRGNSDRLDLVTRLRLCEDHGLGSPRARVAEGNETAPRNPSPTPTPSSSHMPSEWSLVRQDLRALLSSPLAVGTRGNPPIAGGCDAFESCVEVSRQYALRIDIDALNRG